MWEVCAGWSSPATFPRLETLLLSQSFLGGPLPSGWGKAFQSLKTLSLGMNQLTGGLPPGESAGACC